MIKLFVIDLRMTQANLINAIIYHRLGLITGVIKIFLLVIMQLVQIKGINYLFQLGIIMKQILLMNPWGFP